MKDLLIGFSHNLKWEDLKIWIESVNRNIVDSNTDKILVLHNGSKELVDKIKSYGFQIVSPNPQKSDGSYEFNLGSQLLGWERFGEIWSFLKFLKDKYRYILISGTRDVYIQNNPFPYIHEIFEKNLNKNILVAAEPRILKDGWWNAQHMVNVFGAFIFDHLKDEMILNPDVIAGKGSEFIDWLIIFYYVCASTKYPGADQSSILLLSSLDILKDKTIIASWEDAFAMHVSYYNDDTEKDNNTLYLQDKRFILKNDKILAGVNEKEYAIIHQYDRMQILIDLINNVIK